MNLPIITYTNSKCADAWPIYIDLLRKFYGTPHHIMMVDDNIKHMMYDVDTYTYSNKDPFYDVWIKCLSTYLPEFFLYMQEDFFLYRSVDKELLNFYLDLIKENSHISCIRLLKSGIYSNITVEDIPSLHYVDYNTDYAFSMQPTIWRTKDFLKLQKTKLQISPWDEPKLNGNILSTLDIISLYHYNNEPKRGMAHYDSVVFPYIATALVKGKWNTTNYPELVSILNAYNINPNIRGKL